MLIIIDSGHKAIRGWSWEEEMQWRRGAHDFHCQSSSRNHVAHFKFFQSPGKWSFIIMALSSVASDSQMWHTLASHVPVVRGLRPFGVEPPLP